MAENFPRGAKEKLEGGGDKRDPGPGKPKGTKFNES